MNCPLRGITINRNEDNENAVDSRLSLIQIQLMKVIHMIVIMMNKKSRHFPESQFIEVRKMKIQMIRFIQSRIWFKWTWWKSRTCQKHLKLRISNLSEDVDDSLRFDSAFSSNEIDAQTSHDLKQEAVSKRTDRGVQGRRTPASPLRPATDWYQSHTVVRWS
jgi:hypothetical protein